MSPPQQLQSGHSFDSAEQSLQSLIQSLYEISVNIYKFDAPPSSADILINQITDLVQRFQDVDQVADTLTEAHLPREVVSYVEHGRNPDIYTREFVELVVKQNQLLNGKQRAFQDFRDVLAEQINVTFPELQADVKNVLDITGGARNMTLSINENGQRTEEGALSNTTPFTNGMRSEENRG